MAIMINLDVMLAKRNL